MVGRLEAGEIAQWVSLLLHKRGDPGTHKNLGHTYTHTVFIQHQAVGTGSLGLTDCLLAPDLVGNPVSKPDA